MKPNFLIRKDDKNPVVITENRKDCSESAKQRVKIHWNPVRINLPLYTKPPPPITAGSSPREAAGLPYRPPVEQSNPPPFPTV
jgi:hypothetical protein